MDKNKMSDMLSDIQEKVELFYQQKTGEALQQFDGVLQNMLALIDGIFAYKQEHQDFELDENKLQGMLTEAMQALQDRDMILLADIIQYDFIEYTQKLLEAMD